MQLENELDPFERRIETKYEGGQAGDPYLFAVWVRERGFRFSTPVV